MSSATTTIPTDKMGVTGQPETTLKQEFENKQELIDYLVDCNKVSDISGIGSKTSNRVFDWLKEEHPEENRQRLVNDPAYCTEYHTNGETTEDGELIWSFTCPRCGEENEMIGNPKQFRNRPIRCNECNWVSCFHAIFLNEFIVSIDN